MNPLADIEARRLTLGISVNDLERAAALAGRRYNFLMRGINQPTAATLARLKLALQRLALARDCGTDHRAAMIYRMAVALAAGALGRDAAAVLKSDPGRRATQDPAWMAAAEVRRLAFYLMNAGAGMKQTEVARAAGVKKQTVSLAVRELEDMREDAKFDAMLDRLTAQIVGEW